MKSERVLGMQKDIVEKSSTAGSFIDDIIEEELAPGGDARGMRIHTLSARAKRLSAYRTCRAICIDFGAAQKYGGLCNLRVDDTNPTKEDEEYVEAIKEDIHWLGYDWGDRFYYASDYFEIMYDLAVGLIRKGLAYVAKCRPKS